MAVKAKTGAKTIQHQPNKPKRTSIGQGQHSRLRGKKNLRGQGKG